jgi:hypothetical protein
MFKGVRVDNAAWAVLVAIGSLGSGIVSSLSTAASMRRGSRDERRREIDERVDAKIASHASSCKLSDNVVELIERTQADVAVDLDHERDERSRGRQANQYAIEHMRVEIVAGQKEILERVVAIQNVQAAQGARLDAHAVEILRLRDGKNGSGR